MYRKPKRHEAAWLKTSLCYTMSTVYKSPLHGRGMACCAVGRGLSGAPAEALQGWGRHRQGRNGGCMHVHATTQCPPFAAGAGDWKVCWALKRVRSWAADANRKTRYCRIIVWPPATAVHDSMFVDVSLALVAAQRTCGACMVIGLPSAELCWGMVSQAAKSMGKDYGRIRLCCMISVLCNHLP